MANYAIESASLGPSYGTFDYPFTKNIVGYPVTPISLEMVYSTVASTLPTLTSCNFLGS